MPDLVSAFKAAGEPTRLRILHLLRHGELTVSDLTRILRQSQPRVSRHLKLLSAAGLVERQQEGAWAYFRIPDRGTDGRFARRLSSLIEDEGGALARDLERLEAIRCERQRAAEAYFRANAGDWDRIRSLYVPEREVEAVLMESVGELEIGDMLDIGTGTGRMLELFADRIRRGVGIDLSREMLSIARAKLSAGGHGHCHVRLGDMYDLKAADESFDAVVLHQVLHFAEDPSIAVGEAARVLRPGGCLLIVDFAPHELEFLRTEHAHRRLGLAEEDVAQWCAEAGLKADVMARLPGDSLTVLVWRARKADKALRQAA